ELVRPEDGVSCDLLILRHPKAVERLLERTPRIDARRVLLVVNQPPFHYYGEEVSAGRSWDVDRVRKALAGWKEEVEWAPIGPVVREALLEHHAEELRDVRLTEEDWVNIVDLPAWQRSGRRAPDGKVRIGRHSRDYSTKWPETPELLSAIYPEEDGYEIHVLGGARTAAEVRGALPLHWVVHPFHGLSTREFLHGLDVYVYYTNSAYVEAFGRAPLEAMAAGVPTILPPCFRDLFGEAAIYAEPGDVRRTIDTLVADSGRYRMQVERAWEVLEERFGHDAHLRRLSALGVRARGGVHWQRAGLALDRWAEPGATGGEPSSVPRGGASGTSGDEAGRGRTAFGDRIGRHALQNRFGDEDALLVDVHAHGGDGWRGQPAQDRVVPGDQAHPVGYGHPQCPGRAQTRHGHDVVVVEDRGRGLLPGEERDRGLLPRLVGVVSFDDHGRVDPRLAGTFGQRGRTGPGVQQWGRAADPCDSAVPQVEQPVECFAHRGSVVGGHGR